MRQLQNGGAAPPGPLAAFGSLRYASACCGFVFPPEAKAPTGLVDRRTQDRAAIVTEASPFSPEDLTPMEQGVLREDLEAAVRVLLWFARLGVGSSTRLGDRQHTRPSSLRWAADGNLIAQSWAGKTGGRTWAWAAAPSQEGLGL